MTQLSEAVWALDLDRVNAALADGEANEVVYGLTALHTAAERNWAEGIAALIAAGADPNIKSEGGDTPLMTAVIHKQPAAAEALIEGGADLQIPNKVGAPPLCWVVSMNAGRRVEQTSWVMVDGVKQETKHDPEEPYLRAVEVARLLIAGGADPNAVDGGQQTALSRAVMGGDLKLAQMVLEAGGDVNHRNATHYTPLLAAASKGQSAAVAWLIEQGADPSAADDAGFTALHEAAIAGAEELTKTLLDAGADRTLGVKEGWENVKAGMTPREVAEVRGHTGVVALYDA